MSAISSSGMRPESTTGSSMLAAGSQTTSNIVEAALDVLPHDAQVLHEKIETEPLGVFDRKTNCPVDFGSGR